MAETRVSNVSKLHRWSAEFFSEYLREGPFAKYMGTGSNNVIQVKEDLRKGGASINFPYVFGLRGDGVEGHTPLRGNEEEGRLDAHRVFVTHKRNAVLIDDEDAESTLVNLLDAYRDQLMNWAKGKLRNDIIKALLSVGYENSTDANSITDHAIWTYGVTGATATATQLNNWVTYNQGRVLFGASHSNYSTTYATALANVDTTTDTMTSAMLDKAKDLAKDETLYPRMSPVTGDRRNSAAETFVAFLHHTAFQQLRDNLGTNLAQAEVRGRENPLFTGGDLLWNGILCHELQGLPTLSGGASGTSVVPSFLC